MEKEQDGEEQEEEEEEESKDGTQNERKHGTHLVFVNVCLRVNVRCTRVCVCMGWIRCKEEGRRARGRVARAGREKGLVGGRYGERERDAAKQRPSPISILTELNATSYLMPETRQKLQLNGDAISLYLPVHSS